MTVYGIDVSKWQGRIDWAKVAACETPKISLVYVKATEGTIYTDPMMVEHLEGARAVDLPCGVYHYFHHEYSVDEQVERLLDMHRAHQCTLPPALDVEDNIDARIDRGRRGRLVVPWADVGHAVRKFVELWPADVGLKIYTRCNIIGQFDPNDIEAIFPRCQKWIAAYYHSFHGTGEFPTKMYRFGVGLSQADGWQFTDRGRVDGVGGNVDLSLWRSEVLA